MDRFRTDDGILVGMVWICCELVWGVGAGCLCEAWQTMRESTREGEEDCAAGVLVMTGGEWTWRRRRAAGEKTGASEGGLTLRVGSKRRKAVGKGERVPREA
eukprot:350542-Chlamydomonas_euryale.AAC.3